MCYVGQQMRGSTRDRHGDRQTDIGKDIGTDR